jgi:acetyl esterase/lipase
MAVTHRLRRARWAAVALLLVLVAAACDFKDLAPEGAGPMRYRDQVFSAVTTVSGTAYGQATTQQGVSQTLVLDSYTPVGDTVTGRPAIIFVHGGSFAFGTRTSPEIVDEATTFAKKGYVTFSIEYRLSTNGCLTLNAECTEAIVDAREDAQAAVRFLRANVGTYGIDPDRIAIAGTSAGAITAMNVAYGPETPGSSGNPGYSSAVRAAVSLSGGRIGTTPNAGEAAALLFHGTADPIVPYALATNTVTAATNAGLHAELTTWDGAGHVPYAANRTQILDETTNFLFWMLDLPHAPGCCVPV